MDETLNLRLSYVVADNLFLPLEKYELLRSLLISTLMMLDSKLVTAKKQGYSVAQSGVDNTREP